MNLKDFENQILKKSKSKEIPVFKTEFLDIPKGTIIELRGSYSSKITNFSINILNSIQNKGEIGLFVDADHSLDYNLIFNETLLMQPQSPQEIFDVLTQKPLLQCLSVAVVDSVLNLLPLSRDWVQFDKNLQNLRENVKKSNTSIIILNPYISNKTNILSKYTDIIIILRKVRKEKTGILGEGQILKNLVNLNCKKFEYKVNH